MTDFNPYEAPQAEIPQLVQESGAWKDGTTLVMTKDVVLPDRCIKCNLPAEGFRLKRALRWHPPGWYLLVLFNIILYAIVAQFVSHTARIYVGLCPKHRSARRWAIAIGWLTALIGIGVFILSAFRLNSGGSPVFLLAGLLMVVVGGVYGALKARVVTPKDIDKRFVRLSKVNPDYLGQFPYWQD